MNHSFKLKQISIEFMEWGDYKGKYVGKITFENSSKEAFVFNLTPEKSGKYLELISEELVGSASNLANDLMASLNLLPDAFLKLENVKSD